MPHPRRFMLLSLAAVVVGVLVASTAVWFAFPRDVNLDNFKQIKLGMSVSEVDAIFGFRGTKAPVSKEGEWVWSWTRGLNTAEICISEEDGKVTCGCFFSPLGWAALVTKAGRSRASVSLRRLTDPPERRRPCGLTSPTCRFGEELYG